MEQSDRLLDQNLIGLFPVFSKKQQLRLQWLQVKWLHVVNCFSLNRQQQLLLKVYRSQRKPFQDIPPIAFK